MKKTLTGESVETLKEKVEEIEKEIEDSEADTTKVEAGGDDKDSPGVDPESVTAELEESDDLVLEYESKDPEVGPAVCTDGPEDENPEDEDGFEMPVGMDALMNELTKALGRKRYIQASIGVITASVAGALATSRPNAAKTDADVIQLAKDVRKIVEAVVAEDW